MCINNRMINRSPITKMIRINYQFIHDYPPNIIRNIIIPLKLYSYISMIESRFLFFVFRFFLNLLSYTIINLFKNRNDLLDHFYQMANLHLSALMFLLLEE